MINASWELNYDPLIEYSYVQINIYDSVDDLIWNSSWYDEIGIFTEQLIVNTTQLNTTFINHSNKVFIKLYHYYSEGEITIPFLKDTKEITIVKRILLCELTGFKNYINFGEDLTFVATFYDNDIENTSFMNNQLVLLRINANSSLIFQQNFTTNQFGSIEISLKSLEHLNIGFNTLIFIINQNNIYNNSVFQYEILVEKNPVFINIVNINNQLIKNEDLIIQLYYYYSFNNSVTPLNNQSIRIEIQNHHNLIYSHIYNTNDMGLLSITISHTILNFTGETDDCILILHYDGNYFLQNKTVSLFLSIHDPNGKNSFDLNTILIVTISVISLVIPLPFLYRFKKERKKMLTEVVIKY
ncbi:MAG: hypothetical protein ACFFBE_14700 [Promethearchaeota archaeon]